MQAIPFWKRVVYADDIQSSDLGFSLVDWTLFCALFHDTLSDSVNIESNDGLVITNERQMAWKEDTVWPNSIAAFTRINEEVVSLNCETNICKEKT